MNQRLQRACACSDRCSAVVYMTAPARRFQCWMSMHAVPPREDTSQCPRGTSYRSALHACVYLCMQAT